MAFVSKTKKPEPKIEKKSPAVEMPKETQQAGVLTSNQNALCASPRAVISIHPSEAKAFISVNGKKQKVVYHLKDGADPMIGLAGSGSVSLVDWLQGKAELKGLQG